MGVLCDTLERREDKEDTIRRYEQAKIYLDESLTLHGGGEGGKGKGSAQQHPVFGLHDRHEGYMRHEQALTRVNSGIDEFTAKLARVKWQNEKSLGFIARGRPILACGDGGMDNPQRLLKCLAAIELDSGFEGSGLSSAMESLRLDASSVASSRER